MLPEIRGEIMERGGEDDLRAWEECVRILSDAFREGGGDDDDDDGAGPATHDESRVELYLAAAYRWKAWASASPATRKYQRPRLPDPDSLSASLDWLTSADGPLRLSPSQVRENISKHPQTYLDDPRGLYRKAMGSAPRKYRSDDVMRKFIENDPTVLQVTYNCCDEGCQSECGSCWVTYENRLPKL